MGKDLCGILVEEFGVERAIALEIIRRLLEAGDGELNEESLRSALAFGGADLLAALAASSLGHQGPGIENLLEGVEIMEKFHFPPNEDEPIN